MHPFAEPVPEPVPPRAWAAVRVGLAALAFWACVMSMATSYVVIETHQVYALANLPYDAAIVLLGASFCVAMRPLLRRLSRAPLWAQAGVAAVLAATAGAPFEAAMRLAISELAGLGAPMPMRWDAVAQATVMWMGPFGLWAAGNLALLHHAAARERERWLARAQAQAHEAQLKALRYQINPHFLYNTLNAIAALILDRRNEAAEAMVLRLSEFFRVSLAQDPLQDVTLANEIALQRLYLEVEQARFADALSVEVDLPEDLQHALTPGLILQPLVENALKHGLAGPEAPMRLSIRARREGEDRLMLEVADDGRGAGPDGPGEGVGLRNVAQRLATRFPGQAALSVEPVARGFRVRLLMPLAFA